jgi:hypothetical protein
MTGGTLEREVKRLEKSNGGKPFPRRHGELPKSPVKLKEQAGLKSGGPSDPRVWPLRVVQLKFVEPHSKCG